MRAERFLDALRHLPVAAPERLTGGQPFLVLSPHPDDETLGAGGLIAAACATGLRVDVAILTDGAGSHPNSRRYPPDRLIALRKAEAKQAVARLGLPAGRLTHLDLPDTRAPIAGAAFEAAADAVMGLIDQADARSVFVTWGRDPHCDHSAADHLARALRQRRPALRLWSYPIWGWHLDPAVEIDEPAPSGFRIDIAPWRLAKRAAIEAHASQMTDLIDDDPDGFRFDDRTIAPFLHTHEVFFEVPD